MRSWILIDTNIQHCPSTLLFRHESNLLFLYSSRIITMELCEVWSFRQVFQLLVENPVISFFIFVRQRIIFNVTFKIHHWVRKNFFAFKDSLFLLLFHSTCKHIILRLVNKNKCKFTILKKKMHSLLTIQYLVILLKIWSHSFEVNFSYIKEKIFSTDYLQ